MRDFILRYYCDFLQNYFAKLCGLFKTRFNLQAHVAFCATPCDLPCVIFASAFSKSTIIITGVKPEIYATTNLKKLISIIFVIKTILLIIILIAHKNCITDHLINYNFQTWFLFERYYTTISMKRSFTKIA